jgi:hypothetical protein
MFARAASMFSKVEKRQFVRLSITSLTFSWRGDKKDWGRIQISVQSCGNYHFISF